MSCECTQRFFGDWSRIEPKNSQEEIVLAVLKKGEVSWKKIDPLEDIDDLWGILSKFATDTNQDIISDFTTEELIGWNRTIFHANGEISEEGGAEHVEFIP